MVLETRGENIGRAVTARVGNEKNGPIVALADIVTAIRRRDREAGRKRRPCLNRAVERGLPLLQTGYALAKRGIRPAVDELAAGTARSSAA